MRAARPCITAGMAGTISPLAHWCWLPSTLHGSLTRIFSVRLCVFYDIYMARHGIAWYGMGMVWAWRWTVCARQPRRLFHIFSPSASAISFLFIYLFFLLCIFFVFFFTLDSVHRFAYMCVNIYWNIMNIMCNHQAGNTFEKIIIIIIKTCFYNSNIYTIWARNACLVAYNNTTTAYYYQLIYSRFVLLVLFSRLSLFFFSSFSYLFLFVSFSLASRGVLSFDFRVSLFGIFKAEMNFYCLFILVFGILDERRPFPLLCLLFLVFIFVWLLFVSLCVSPSFVFFFAYLL